MVRRQHLLAVPPQVVHRVEVRAPLGQPQQLDPQLVGGVLGVLRRMATVLVQQQRHVPAPVKVADLLQEVLEVHAALPLACQQQPAARLEVDGPEQDALGVAATDRNRGRLPTAGPAGAQGREQPQGGLVPRQLRATRRQGPQPPPDGAFFSRAGGPAGARSGTASTRSPAGRVPGGRYRRTAAGHHSGTGSPGAGGPSRSAPHSPVRRGAAPSRPAAAPATPGSRRWGGRRRTGLGGSRGRGRPRRNAPSWRRSDASRAAGRRLRRRTSLGPAQAEPTGGGSSWLARRDGGEYAACAVATQSDARYSWQPPN